MTTPDDPYAEQPPHRPPTGYPPPPFAEPPDAHRPYAEPYGHPPYAETPYGYGPGRSGPHGEPPTAPSGIYLATAVLYVFAAGGLLIGLYAVVEGSRVRSLDVAGLSDAGSVVIAMGAFFLVCAVADVLVAVNIRRVGGRIGATVMAGLWSLLWLLSLLGGASPNGAAGQAVLSVVMLAGCAAIIVPLWNGPARAYYEARQRR